MGGIGILLLTAVPPTRMMREETSFGERATLWGLDRHQWGFIHLTLALLVLFLLVLHLYFHWAQIKCLYRRWTNKHPVKQLLLGPLFLLTCIALLGIPCFLKPSVQYKATSGTSFHNMALDSNRRAVNVSAEHLPWPPSNAIDSNAGKGRNRKTTHHTANRKLNKPFNEYIKDKIGDSHMNRRNRKSGKAKE